MFGIFKAVINAVTHGYPVTHDGILTDPALQEKYPHAHAQCAHATHKATFGGNDDARYGIARSDANLREHRARVRAEAEARAHANLNNRRK